MARTEKARWAEEYLGTTRKWPHHFLFPRAFVRAHVPDLPSVPAYFYHQTLMAEFPRICDELSRKGFFEQEKVERSEREAERLAGARSGDDE